MLEISAKYLKLSSSCRKLVCEPGWSWNVLNQPFVDYDLWYIWDGEGQCKLNDIIYTVHKGSCMLFRPGDRVVATHNPNHPLTVTFIHFHIQRLDPSITSFTYIESSAWFEA